MENVTDNQIAGAAFAVVIGVVLATVAAVCFGYYTTHSVVLCIGIAAATMLVSFFGFTFFFGFVLSND